MHILELIDFLEVTRYFGMICLFVGAFSASRTASTSHILCEICCFKLVIWLNLSIC